MTKPVWEKPNPVKKHSILTPLQKAKARARARSAGRPYPNMVDNIWASRNEATTKKKYIPYIHFRDYIDIADLTEDVARKPKFPKHGDSLDPYAEAITPDLGWRNYNDNEHLGKTSAEISKRLYNTTPALTSQESHAVKSHTNQSSYEMSTKLINKEKITSSIRNKAIKLHDIVSKPLGHKISLYSGVSSDPRGWEKHSDGSTQLRAATSMTHDKFVSHYFATMNATDTSNPTHIIHLHANPTDRGLYVAHHAESPDEYETILPPNTYIKPHPNHTEPEEHIDSDGKKVFIHHYVIHKQSKPGEYQPGKLAVNEEFNLKRLGSNPGKFKRLVAKHLGSKAANKIDGADGSKIMAIAKRKGDTGLFRQGSFIKNFYGEALEIGTKEIRVAYSRMTPGQEKISFDLGHDANVPQDNKTELRRRKAKKIFRAYFDEEKANKPLGKPFRTPGERKKFAVYVRNDSGNVVKVRFGDPNLSIKRDNPARRRSFRARHNCANPGPRTKAKYWSCRMWSKTRVSDIT